MHVERMKQWVDAIVNWDRKFSLATWLSYGDSGNICSACAGGIATIAFETQVLRSIMGMPCVLVDGQQVYGMSAIGVFFDIPREMARFICAPDFYDDGNLTPKEVVIARINGLIAGHQDVLDDCTNRTKQLNAERSRLLSVFDPV